jgi:hypothetical protein
MQLRTRASLGGLFAVSAVAATALAWHVQRTAPTCSTRVIDVPVAAQTPVGAQVPVGVPVPAVQPAAPAPEDDAGDDLSAEAPGPDAPCATIDKLELAWMPKGYVRDVGAEKTTALAQLVEAWAASDSQEPRIEYRRGVVFARSDEDRGDDGPYPRSAQAQGQRVCGDASVWMRAALRERIANAVLTCDRNVCSYGGMEYAPDGYLVFREVTIDGETTWALDAWVEMYRAALPAAAADRNRAQVVSAMKRLATTACGGEPAGAY